MTILAILSALLLVLALLTCWFVTLLGLPGNWLMVGAAAVYAALGPVAAPLAIGWPAVVALAVLAALGELIELATTSLGVGRVGGSRRSALLALVGSLVGGVVGMFAGALLTILGSLVATLLLAGVGALAGAVLGEQWKGRDLGTSLRVGRAAFWGRMLGTLGKTLVASVMVVLGAAAVVV